MRGTAQYELAVAPLIISNHNECSDTARKVFVGVPPCASHVGHMASVRTLDVIVLFTPKNLLRYACLPICSHMLLHDFDARLRSCVTEDRITPLINFSSSTKRKAGAKSLFGVSGAIMTKSRLTE